MEHFERDLGHSGSLLLSFTLAISSVPDIALDFPVTIQVLPASSVSKLLLSYVAVPSTVFALSNSRVYFAPFFRVVATPITQAYHIRELERANTVEGTATYD